MNEVAGVAGAGTGRGRALKLSWPDALMAAIDALPGPTWVAYAVVAMALGLLGEATRWAAGFLPLWTIDPQYLVEGTFPALFFGSASALNGVARRAVIRLGPALHGDRATLVDFQIDIVRTPGAPATVAVIAAVVTAILSVIGDPKGYGLTDGSSALAWIAAVTFGAMSTASVYVFLVHAVHQLRLIERVHRDLVRIDIYHLEPLYSFASLTARTGITLVAITVYGIAVFSAVTGTLIGTGSVIDALTVTGILGVAVACFVVPLLGLHGRISDERDLRRADAAAVVGRTIAEIETRSAAGDHEGVAGLYNALQASTTAVASISRISTWPWRPETLRGFVSAIGLPVVIWVITAVLSRVFPR